MLRANRPGHAGPVPRLNSDTLDALLGKLDRGEIALSWKDVIVVDEAGMVGTRPGAPLERYAKHAGAKMIEIGDRRRLQSVLAGGEVHGAWERLGCRRTRRSPSRRSPPACRRVGAQIVVLRFVGPSSDGPARVATARRLEGRPALRCRSAPAGRDPMFVPLRPG